MTKSKIYILFHCTLTVLIVPTPQRARNLALFSYIFPSPSLTYVSGNVTSITKKQKNKKIAKSETTPGVRPGGGGAKEGSQC